MLLFFVTFGNQHVKMKTIFSCLLFLCIITVTEAQADYTGNYHFQSKVYYDKDSEIKPGKDELDLGRMGDLTLLKIDSFNYKFWLSANRGWPSYNQGNLDGIISVKDGKAIFSVLQEYSDSACKINFRFYNNYVKVDQLSTDNDCGFGMNVYADGRYPKKNANRLKNKDLENMYIDYTKYKVQSDKTYLYEDGAGSTVKKQYFIKSDTVLAFSETPLYIYTEFISTSGKFIYGWLKKSELKEMQ